MTVGAVSDIGGVDIDMAQLFGIDVDFLSWFVFG